MFIKYGSSGAIKIKQHDELLQERRQLQIKLVLWIVMTISFYVIQYFVSWQVVMYVAWLSAAYCLILFLMLVRITWLLSKRK
ncbi:hypothetical protein ABTQ33_05730 [Paucilactobacillus suebicus]|uniref:Uncharacterized protein n=1 Tax=Paucilactobacillus suebicus DSM 5007 = KCTC 3549 TaxID=1423807 RepID=A0A0R1WB97_9LACO|nr:hypothetical protein [Paucilactobacillus suebicus]KRM12777.1 hypothetical protein FD16_GL001955 [Paucilactobacillus suebicus DSM 5007 = KCTC 3549]